jgi:hypothetical protein
MFLWLAAPRLADQPRTLLPLPLLIEAGLPEMGENMMRSVRLYGLSVGTVLLAGVGSVFADDAPTSNAKKDASPVAATSTEAAAAQPAAAQPAKPATPEYEKYTGGGATKINGLFTLYRKDGKLYAELTANNYSSEYIVLLSIARGIGSGPLLGGMTWGFGDDWVWQFRKIEDNVHIIRRNVRFRAEKGTPEASAVQNAYTDSVLFSLPVVTKGPGGGDLVDLTSVFMSDLPQISQVLPGFGFAQNKSTWAAVKGFENNTEIQVAATYASGGSTQIESVADTRGVTVNVHYSISKIPTTGYTSRLADDRVGYFLTVVKDYSKKSERDQFVRYINRWNLQKADPSAALSPPKQPIIFWIEKTVPFQYRKPIREGILEWNKAFEAAGFVNAIEVRQQPDNADWDPEDINYNTFRWITSSAGFAMGPSRVNPYTGQILDADIIFDADFLTYWKHEFETFTPEAIAAMTGGPLDLESYEKHVSKRAPFALSDLQSCRRTSDMARQFALGASFALANAADAKQLAEMQDQLIIQGLKEVTMHEVGHTLGLRHNFKASTWLSLEDINNPEKTKSGSVASVMDYTPTNLAVKGQKQGDYFTPTIGPYDIWAIQYGYTSLSGGTTGETAELNKIAARSGEAGLAYSTDEDTRGIDPDPQSNRFDLGSDALAFAKQRAQVVKDLLPEVVTRMTKDGEDYTQARQAFNILLATHGQSMHFASRYVGGLELSRSHKGDKDAKAPVQVIDPAKQREALKLLGEQVFSEQPFLVPAEVYNHLASSRWSHWGAEPTTRPDFPVHDVIIMWQDRILAQLLSSLTLERLHDAELKVAADKDAFTTAELIESLTKLVFAEVDQAMDGEYTTRKPAVNSIRRNLQRTYLRRLSNLAMGSSGAPDDCQTIAYGELASLNDRIKKLLDSKVKLDSYSKAHLQESSARIQKVLDARLSLNSP